MTSPAPSAAPAAPAFQVPQWTFADRIRKVRRDVLQIEQSAFADQLGVTRQAYAAWESGRNEPRSILAVAKRIEAMSRVPAAWILGVDHPSTPTGAHTSQYETATRRRASQLSLVPALPATYQAVDASYGSSPCVPEYAKGRRVPSSSGTVNCANAA
jgi:DNA-binding XRE family transcriptional regulator